MGESLPLDLQLCNWILILAPGSFHWLIISALAGHILPFLFYFFLGTSKHTSGERVWNPFLKVAAALGVCVYIMDATYRQIWVKAIWPKHGVLWASLLAELCLPNASKCPAEGSDAKGDVSDTVIPLVTLLHARNPWSGGRFFFWASSKPDHLSFCISSLCGWKLLSFWPTRLKPGISNIGCRK